jgi:hypothetical protein
MLRLLHLERFLLALSCAALPIVFAVLVIAAGNVRSLSTISL